MLCKKPMRVKDEAGFHQMVNCGQCMPCRINRREGWTGRLLMEMRQHRSTSFTTLTYAEAPAEGVMKRDLQLFMKRLRFDFREKIRYFGVGEYGERTGRPHYHALLFGFPWTESARISKAWPMGFTTTSEANRSRARYVAGYTIKKLSSSSKCCGRAPEFALMSRMPGIGAGYLPQLLDSVRRAQPTLLSPRQEEYGKVWIPYLWRLEGKLYPLDDYCRSWLKERLTEEYSTRLGKKVVEDLKAARIVKAGDPRYGERVASDAKAQRRSRRSAL